jgi:fatty acid elongase 3
LEHALESATTNDTGGKVIQTQSLYNEEELLMAPWPLALGACLAFVCLLVTLQWIMRSRKPLSIRFLLCLHNGFLALLSLVLFLGLFLSLIWITISDGFWAANCDPERKHAKGALVFWSYMFYLSKYYEWLDTVFLVLKKKPITFLHVYHHVLTLWISWGQLHTGSFKSFEPVIANAFVHIWMYYYFFVRTLGKTVWWRKHLTQLQITQFFFDLVTTPYKIYLHWKGDCIGTFQFKYQTNSLTI